MNRSSPAGPPTGAGPIRHPVSDRMGRPMRDLRISVTDRCNFRCVYCMPKEFFGRDYAFLPKEEILSYEEIYRLARVFVELGVQKIRLTGGEPLVRRHVERLVAVLATLPDIDLTMTTNGSLLREKAPILKEAGLQRITVSLDSLDPVVFAALNDVGFPVQRVLDGIDAAAAAGLTPLKVNMVVRRGYNEDSIVPMARFCRSQGHLLRFIEYMDVGHTNGWRLDDMVPASEIVAILNAVLPLKPLEPNYRGEVANRFAYLDGSGEVGVIASVTQPFCQDCTRARISADGKLFTCLFATTGRDLKSMLRNGTTDDEISAAMAGIWRAREDRYSELRSAETLGMPKVEMSYIGG
ncbi:MAG: GTP 3',8-cyclase MoaA [Anaerolineae bacterium]